MKAGPPMDARDDILARLRAARERAGRTRAAALADVRAAFATPTQRPRPALEADPAELVARFRREALHLSSSVDEVAGMDAVPAAVARYLAQAGLAPHGVVWPRPAALDWAGAGLTMAPRAARDADPVGVTGCFCAIAETGTPMTCSAPDSPAATSLLPETHIAVVPASRIVAGIEEGWVLARRELGAVRRQLHLGAFAQRRHRDDDRARRARPGSRPPHPGARGVTPPAMRIAAASFAVNEAATGYCGIKGGVSLYCGRFRPASPGLVFVGVMPRNAAAGPGLLMPTRG